MEKSDTYIIRNLQGLVRAARGFHTVASTAASTVYAMSIRGEIPEARQQQYAESIAMTISSPVDVPAYARYIQTIRGAKKSPAQDGHIPRFDNTPEVWMPCHPELVDRYRVDSFRKNSDDSFEDVLSAGLEKMALKALDLLDFSKAEGILAQAISRYEIRDADDAHYCQLRTQHALCCFVQGKGVQNSDAIEDLIEFRGTERKMANRLLYALALCHIHHLEYETAQRLCQQLWENLEVNSYGPNKTEVLKLLFVTYRLSNQPLLAEAIKEEHPTLSLHPAPPTAMEFIFQSEELVGSLFRTSTINESLRKVTSDLCGRIGASVATPLQLLDALKKESSHPAMSEWDGPIGSSENRASCHRPTFMGYQFFRRRKQSRVYPDLNDKLPYISTSSHSYDIQDRSWLKRLKKLVGHTPLSSKPVLGLYNRLNKCRERKVVVDEVGSRRKTIQPHVLEWLLEQEHEEHAIIPSSPSSSGSHPLFSFAVEMAADSPLVELMDTSPAVELEDTGLTYEEVIKKTHLGPSPYRKWNVAIYPSNAASTQPRTRTNGSSETKNNWAHTSCKSDPLSELGARVTSSQVTMPFWGTDDFRQHFRFKTQTICPIRLRRTLPIRFRRDTTSANVVPPSSKPTLIYPSPTQAMNLLSAPDRRIPMSAGHGRIIQDYVAPPQEPQRYPLIIGKVERARKARSRLGKSRSLERKPSHEKPRLKHWDPAKSARLRNTTYDVMSLQWKP